MSTRKQGSADKERFWRTTMRQWRRSGMSVRAFCEAHGLAQPTFYAWRRSLAHRDPKHVQFVPVQVIPETRPVSTTDEAFSGLELVLNDRRRLRIQAGFDAATLQRLLTVLEEGRP